MLDELAKDSKKLNILPGALKELRIQAALIAGVEGPQVDKALARMRIALGDVVRLGTGPAAESLDALGISIDDILRLPTLEQFDLLRDALSNVRNQTMLASHANNLFGRAGKELIPLQIVTGKH